MYLQNQNGKAVSDGPSPLMAAVSRGNKQLCFAILTLLNFAGNVSFLSHTVSAVESVNDFKPPKPLSKGRVSATNMLLGFSYLLIHPEMTWCHLWLVSFICCVTAKCPPGSLAQGRDTSPPNIPPSTGPILNIQASSWPEKGV